jgi:hypothetical protein
VPPLALLYTTTFCTFLRELSPPHALEPVISASPVVHRQQRTIIRGMATITRAQCRYDHRLRDLVRSTQDINCALQRGVPRSTARGWLTGPAARVVTIDVLSLDTMQLQQEVLRLRTRIQKLIALLRILLVVLKISKFSFGQARVPEDHEKRSLLQVIDRSRSVLPLRVTHHPAVAIALSPLEPPAAVPPRRPPLLPKAVTPPTHTGRGQGDPRPGHLPRVPTRADQDIGSPRSTPR